MDIVVRCYKSTDIVVAVLTCSTKHRIVKFFTINREDLSGWAGFPTDRNPDRDRLWAIRAQPSDV